MAKRIAKTPTTHPTKVNACGVPNRTSAATVETARLAAMIAAKMVRKSFI